MATGLVVRMLDILPPRPTLKLLLHLDNILNAVISHVAVNYGGGIHPKHWLTDYHEFFVRNVKTDDRVVDIGCGTGEVTYDVATRARPKLII